MKIRDIREALPPHLAKHFDKDGNPLKGSWKDGKWTADKKQPNKPKGKWKDVTPKGYGPDESIKENVGETPIHEIMREIERALPDLQPYGVKEKVLGIVSDVLYRADSQQGRQACRDAVEEAFQPIGLRVSKDGESIPISADYWTQEPQHHQVHTALKMRSRYWLDLDELKLRQAARDLHSKGVAEVDGYRFELKKLNHKTMETLGEDSVCWDGYEKVPGKKDYEKGSCRKKTKNESALDKRPNVVGNATLAFDSGDYRLYSRYNGGKRNVWYVTDQDDNVLSQGLAPKSAMTKAKLSAAEKRTLYSEENQIVGILQSERINKTQVRTELPTRGQWFDDHNKAVEYAKGQPGHLMKVDSNGNVIGPFEESAVTEKEGGMSDKERKAYNRKHGSNLKRAQPSGGKRRTSYCARSKGQMNMHNIDCRDDRDKPICKARRDWNC